MRVSCGVGSSFTRGRRPRVRYAEPTAMTRFNANEVLELALAIERTGEAFYRRAEQSVSDQKVRDTFRTLALEEVDHERVFRRMLERIGRFDPGDGASEDYYAYLRAYVDNVVFSQERASELLDTARDTEAALRFAMQREQDAILFYLELKNLVPVEEHDVIDRILTEERGHFTKLAGLLGEGAREPA